MPSQKKHSLIVLDRDGVINQDSPNFIKSHHEWHAIPGSLEAITKLNQYGYKVIVATNQSGLTRGLLTVKDLQAIHLKMETELRKLGGHLNDIFICPHVNEDHCSCRKPQDGLLKNISSVYNTSPQNILCIGDSLRDLEAASNFGCEFCLVLTGNGEKTLSKLHLGMTTHVFDNLQKTVEYLLSTKTNL